MTRPATVSRRAIGAGVGCPIRAAVGFLTRIPVSPGDGIATGAAAFGVVGALIGVAGAIVLLLLGPRAPLAAGAAAVGALALVSGGLHLDGLADTADALAAPTAEAATRARKDPRVGAAGAAAIAIAVVLDAALLAGLVGRKGALEAALVCLVATAGSRAIAPFVAALIRRPAEGSGVGRWFIGGTGAGAALVATGSVLVLAGAAAFAISTPALVGGLVGGTVATLAVAVWLARLRDGLDGDGFGALIEVGFAAILLATTLGA
jgi:adenosylcobinamide-GDP ribazoletransferase